MRANISNVCIKFRPILCQVCVGNVRKYHVLVSRTCRKSQFWSSGQWFCIYGSDSSGGIIVCTVIVVCQYARDNIIVNILIVIIL